MLTISSGKLILFDGHRIGFSAGSLDLRMSPEWIGRVGGVCLLGFR